MTQSTADVTATVASERRSPAPIAGRSAWRLAWERLRRDKVAMISLAVVVLVFLMAIFAPVIGAITGHDPDTQYRETGLTEDGLPVAPNSEFWFGTDDLGRDILVRIVYGARISLLVGVVATLLTVVVGVLVGLAAGYYRGVIDVTLARLVDVVLAFPFFLFAVSLVSVTGPSLWVAILVISLFSWASVARIVRGQTLSIREKEYVEAARSLGSGDGRIMLYDVLPNVTAPVIVYASLLVPVVIVTEASLSFLGLGVPPPTPTWGGMLQEASQFYRVAWWFLVFPGLALLITTLAFNLFGDGVRDAFDPRADRLLGD
jgi:peptide/nickel transport system permease protein